MKRKSHICSIAAGLIAMSAVAIASDSAAEVYPGTDCRAFSLQSGGGALKILHTRVENSNSTDDLRVVCPFVNPSNPTIPGPLRWVVNTSISSDWSVGDCNVFMTTYDGNSLTSPPSPTLSQVGSTYQYYWSQGFVPNGFGPITVACWIPHNQAIFKYEQLE